MAAETLLAGVASSTWRWRRSNGLSASIPHSSPAKSTVPHEVNWMVTGFSSGAAGGRASSLPGGRTRGSGGIQGIP